jgi:hypothetical protein
MRTHSVKSKLIQHSAIVCCILISFSAFSQSAVTGVVVNNDNQPLANASVLLLLAKDSTVVKATVSGSEGKYKFEYLSPGNYLLTASFTGLQQVYRNHVVVVNTEMTVDTLQLASKETQLGSVIVAARRPLYEQKIDRVIINVGSSVNNAGSTALDVLMRSPGVDVDQQNNSIVMSGKDGVVVMMNGKISRMPVTAVVQMLAGMNANNIDRIELITTPPANFDAEGNAGYINIVMKTSNFFGTNGNYAFTTGYGRKPVVASSINFNHRSGRWNLFGDCSFAHTGLRNTFVFYRSVSQGSKNLETNAETNQISFRSNHTGRLGVDVEMSSKTTVGALFSTFNNLQSITAVNNSRVLLNGMADTSIIIDNDQRHPIRSYTANLNLAHQFSVRQKINLNADYVYFNDAQDVNYNNQYYNGTDQLIGLNNTRSFKRTPIRFLVGNADYYHKLFESVELESGIKATQSRFTNDVKVEKEQQSTWIIDEPHTSLHFLNERILAAYSSFFFKKGKTSIKTGVRYEHTTSNLSMHTVKNIVDRRYGGWFPSFFLSHAIKESQSVNLSFTRRITRPTFTDLAPFVYFVDPNTLFSGNPSLQPSISSSVKADYLVKRFIFSVTGSFEQNPITNFAPRVDAATNRQMLVAENQKNRKVASLNIALPIRLTNWWNTQTNLSGVFQELNAVYNGAGLQITQRNFTINSTHSFSLPKSYTIELRGLAQSGGLFGIYRLNAYGTMDLGVQKKFADNKSILRINVNDFWGAPILRPSVNIPEQNLVAGARLQFANRFFRLTFTRSFGDKQVKSTRVRTTASDEERQRVSTN